MLGEESGSREWGFSDNLALKNLWVVTNPVYGISARDGRVGNKTSFLGFNVFAKTIDIAWVQKVIVTQELNVSSVCFVPTYPKIFISGDGLWVADVGYIVLGWAQVVSLGVGVVVNNQDLALVFVLS